MVVNEKGFLVTMATFWKLSKKEVHEDGDHKNILVWTDKKICVKNILGNNFSNSTKIS